MQTGHVSSTRRSEAGRRSEPRRSRRQRSAGPGTPRTELPMLFTSRRRRCPDGLSGLQPAGHSIRSISSRESGDHDSAPEAERKSSCSMRAFPGRGQRAWHRPVFISAIICSCLLIMSCILSGCGCAIAWAAELCVASAALDPKRHAAQRITSGEARLFERRRPASIRRRHLSA